MPNAGMVTVNLKSNNDQFYSEMVKASQRLVEISKTGRSAGHEIAQGMIEAGTSVAVFSSAAGRDIRLLTGFIEKHSAAVATAGVTGEKLVNTYRGVRLALSPTIFTAAAIGAGILVEQTVKLVNARAKIIEQQSLIAAKTGISFADVEHSDLTAKLSGSSSATGLAALTALRNNIQSGDAQSALQSLGIPEYARANATPQLLADIAEKFSLISDPALRAKAAVDLFGADLAGEVLPTLNQRFADNSRRVDEWGLGLSKVSRDNIYQLKRDIDNLKLSVHGLGDSITAMTESTTQGFVSGAAGIWAWINALRTASEYQKQNAADADRKKPVSDIEARRVLALAAQQNLQRLSPADSSNQVLAANAQVGIAADSKEALEDQLSKARELKRLAAQTAGDPGGAGLYIAMQQKVAGIEAQIKALSDLKKSQEDLANAAKIDASNAIEANQRTAESVRQKANDEIRFAQLVREGEIDALRDPHERAIQGADAEVKSAQDRLVKLRAIYESELAIRINLINKRAALEGTASARSTANGEIAGARSETASRITELYASEADAEQKSANVRSTANREVQDEWDEMVRKGFDDLDKGWKEAQHRVDEYFQKYFEGEAKVAEIQAKSGGQVAIQGLQRRKLEIERGQVGQVTTPETQISIMRQMAAISAAENQERIATLQRERSAAEGLTDINEQKVKLAEIDGQLADARAKAGNDEFEAQTKIGAAIIAANAGLEARLTLAQNLTNWSRIGVGTFEQDLVNAAVRLPDEVAGSLIDSLFNRPKRGQTKGQEVLGGLAKTGEGAAKTVGTELLTHGIEKLFGVVGKDAGLIAALTANTAAVSGNTAAQTGGAVAGAAGSASGIVGIFSKLFGPLGKLFGPLLGIFGLAEGTDSAPGGLTLVGEKGPEIRNVPRGSQIIPNHLIGSFLGATSPRAYPSIPSSALSSRSSSSTAFGSMVSSQSHSVNVGGIAVYEASNPGETARQIADYLKGVSPQWSPANG